jgi:hypothetical protein
VSPQLLVARTVLGTVMSVVAVGLSLAAARDLWERRLSDAVAFSVAALLFSVAAVLLVLPASTLARLF